MNRIIPVLLLLPLWSLAAAGPPPAAATASQHAPPPAAATASRHAPSPRVIDLTPPNFLAPQWQERLQGPTIDRSAQLLPEAVIVTPPEEHRFDTALAPAGIGSLFWAVFHPSQSWRVLMPVQASDDFDTDREIAMAYMDPQSDCPGFPGTPNVRPICP